MAGDFSALLKVLGLLFGGRYGDVVAKKNTASSASNVTAIIHGWLCMTPLE